MTDLTTPADQKFWQGMDHLIAEGEVVIDRPRGSRHPRYPDFVYPYDYGYLKNTTAADMGGIDVWAGSHPEHRVTAVICTVDLLKHDTEIKILLGCDSEEVRTILALHNEGAQSAVAIIRPMSTP